MEFNGSPAATIGIELELQLLDAASLDLMNGIVPLLRLFPDREDVKPEMVQSCVEITSPVCDDAALAEQSLRETLVELLPRCDSLGMKLCGAGTHPFGRHLALITPSPRYLRMKSAYGILGRNQLTFATHVHVGVPTAEAAIYVMRHLTPCLPLILALAANSPYWRGHETGFASYRQCILAATQSYGLPPYFDNWESFVRFCAMSARADVFSSVKDIHWDLRPRPDLGTVEIRVMDSASSLRTAGALAALARLLVVYLTEHAGSDPLDWPVAPQTSWIERINRYRASLDGLSGRYIVDEAGHSRPTRELLQDLIELVAPVAGRIGERRGLRQLRSWLAEGVGYETQRDVFAAKGGCREVVRSLVAMLEDDCETRGEASLSV